jgi:hypothetical protein
VYEPPGTIDTWGAIGTQPCIVHIKVTGVVEYLDEDGEVTETVSVCNPACALPALVRAARPSASRQLNRVTTGHR